MRPELLLFAVGGLLLVTGLVGGGFEMRELKVPQVGRIARVLATGAGIVCIMLGLGVSTLTTPTDAGANGGDMVRGDDPQTAHFTIRDELGEMQVSEQVVVILDGRRVGVLTVNADYGDSQIEVAVPAGSHDYTLSASSVEMLDDGSVV